MRTQLYDRIGEGEEIYFLLGEELDDALVVACSAGALEVAYPPAYLRGETLTYCEPRHLVPPEPMPKAGTVRFRQGTETIAAAEDPRVPLARSVLLIDDGLLPTPDIVAMASSLRNAGPRQLTVVAPWLSLEALAALTPGQVRGESEAS